MKDKLTKRNLTRFDRICNQLRKFSIGLIAISFIAFLPINQQLSSDSNIITTEIATLKNQDDIFVASRERPVKIVRHYHYLDF